MRPLDPSETGSQPADSSLRCAQLLCLLRLSEIVLADPEPISGLQAVVDELMRMPRVACAAIGLIEPDSEDLSVPAHRNLPGRRAHQAFVHTDARMARRAIIAGGILTARSSTPSPWQTCAYVPITDGEQPLGVLDLGLTLPVPLGSWVEEILWTSADYVAMLLVGRPGRSLHRPERSKPAQHGLPATTRQRDVLFELVEHDAGNRAIAERLGLSERTVKIHLAGIYKALGVRRRGEAIHLILTRHQSWLQQERARRARGSVEGTACDSPPPSEADDDS